MYSSKIKYESRIFVLSSGTMICRVQSATEEKRVSARLRLWECKCAVGFVAPYVEQSHTRLHRGTDQQERGRARRRHEQRDLFETSPAVTIQKFFKLAL